MLCHAREHAMLCQGPCNAVPGRSMQCCARDHAMLCQGGPCNAVPGTMQHCAMHRGTMQYCAMHRGTMQYCVVPEGPCSASAAGPCNVGLCTIISCNNIMCPAGPCISAILLVVAQAAAGADPLMYPPPLCHLQPPSAGPHMEPRMEPPSAGPTQTPHALMAAPRACSTPTCPRSSVQPSLVWCAAISQRQMANNMDLTLQTYPALTYNVPAKVFPHDSGAPMIAGPS